MWMWKRLTARLTSAPVIGLQLLELPHADVAFDVGTQDETGTCEWTSFDLGRALSALNSPHEAVVRWMLRRLHIRL